MGAVLKNPIPQLVEASRPTAMSTLFLDESLARIPTINAKEIRHLSRFLPVIVLIHKSTIKSLASPGKPTPGGSPTGMESNKILGLFGQAMERFSTTDADRAFVFGQVTVNMDSMEA